MTKSYTQKFEKQIVNFLVFFDLTIQKNRYVSSVFHPGAPEPDPPPNKKVSEAENGARELKKLAPSPRPDQENFLSEAGDVNEITCIALNGA